MLIFSWRSPVEHVKDPTDATKQKWELTFREVKNIQDIYMTINKSKISSVYNKDFTDTKLRKIPKKRAVYIPNNLPANSAPRTVYHVSGLKKYLNSKMTNNPPSPATRKPLTFPWYKKLYTKDEIEASKHARSNKFKLINHMKTRKHLSSKQKLEYLNRLKNGESLNKIVNNINRLTIPKRNIIVKNNLNLQSVVQAFQNFNTDHNIFKRVTDKRTIANKGILKQVRILTYKQLLKDIKNIPNFNHNYEPLYRKYQKILNDLEDIIFTVTYVESSDFRYVKGIKDVRKNLYSVIEKNMFKPGGILKIQLYVVHSFNKLIFGNSVSEDNLYFRSKQILKMILSEGRLDGFKLEDWLMEDYNDYISNIVNKLSEKNYNINFNYNRLESVVDKVKQMLKDVVLKYYPNNNKNAAINKINKLNNISRYTNTLNALPGN